ncbi:MAG: hemolysin family protein [Lachnospiraceae bacterium]|nr:hemolysin family protein [Lachnospiraceae bacterium]
MDSSDAIQLIVLFILLLLSGFFSSSETAFTTVNKVRIRSLAEEGNTKAVTVQKILDRYPKMLSSILIGNNIVNLSASAIATALTIRLFGNYMVGFATGLLTICVLIFGEIIPKTSAATNAEKYALRYCGIIYRFMFILTPVIFLVDRLSQAAMWLFHMNQDKELSAMTESELKTYVDVSHEDGVIESDERTLIYNVFDFSDALAKDIMIPRIDMVTAEVNTAYEDLREMFRDSMYTRIPVYEDDPDQIIGLVNVKDFLLVNDTSTFQIRDIMRDAYYTYELKKSADLLTEMRDRAMNVSFVLNEYGATIGMITMEDLLEELVGEIRDEYDRDEEELIHKIYDRQYLIAAGMKLDDVNDALHTDFDSEDYDSLGGIIIEKLDRMPADGDVVTLENGVVLKVRGVKDNRIEQVLVTLPVSASQTEG